MPRLATTYGGYFIQFPIFTYIMIGGFDGIPLNLPRFTNDKLVLIEVCKQISIINKRCKERKNGRILFPFGLTDCNCNSSYDTYNIEKSLVNFILYFQIMRFSFDNK